ncbi:transducin family protein [Actinidia rufa]|uniref:Transducin family protein n=1 Tax=Actinidia rufa TaxID=165716 RepID=A0A7J0G1K3_9ERIC|nr:transducin family protein [Actinidia rufa]
MAEDHQIIAKTFPVKPKLKPTSTKSTSAESKYWKSFKPQPIQTLIASITSLSFSPAPPHDFAASHSATVTIFSSQTLEPKSTISSFADTATSASFRSDGRLLAAGSHSGIVQVFDVKSRTPLRHLRRHSRPVHLVRYPRIDKLHLFSGGDDAVVRFWDVASETQILEFTGHKDYVRSGDCSPASDDLFVTGSYDHTIRLWDVRVSSGGSMMEVNHGKPVEDVIFLPSGGLIATAGGDSVKIWDVIGGGKLLYSMESHNKTVTALCVGKIGKESGDEAQQNRILSVSLDGYMKVLDYAKFKITHSMRFPSPLLIGWRKTKENVGAEVGNIAGLGPINEPPKRALRPSYFRYFHRGQNEKASEGDYLVMRPKKVKLAEHDKLLKKFRHKEALVSALRGKNPENVRYATMPRYAGLLMKLAKKVVEMRAEDVRSDDVLKGHIRNLKRSVEEEIRIQQSLQEIQGIISPLLRIAERR